MATKTKSKKSFDSLKKQKVDGKKVKGGISAGSIHSASSVGSVKPGSLHNPSAAGSKFSKAGHLTGAPKVYVPIDLSKGGPNENI